MTLPPVLRNGAMQRLLTGQAVSSLGDWLGTFALMALTLELTGSPTAVGGILVLRLLPSAVAGPLAAKVSQRWDRKRTMLTTDLLRAGIVALVPLVQAVWWVYLWALLLELASLLFLPARDSAVPDLVGDEGDLSTANGLVLASSYGNIPLGAAAFALVSWATGSAGGFLGDHPHAVALWVDAATFVISWSILRGLPDLGTIGDEGAGEGTSPSTTRFRDAFSHPTVRAVMPGATTVFIGVGALFTLGIPYVREVLGASNVEFGWLVALFGVGGTFGLALSRTYGSGSGLRPIRDSVAALGVVLSGMALLSQLWIGYIGAVLFGTAATYALVSAMTYLQSRLEGQERTMGFTAFHVLLRLAMSLAAIGAGLAAEAFGPVDAFGAEFSPTAVVLFASGVIVLSGSGMLHVQTDEGTTDADRDRDGQRRVATSEPA